MQQKLCTSDSGYFSLTVIHQISEIKIIDTKYFQVWKQKNHFLYFRTVCELTHRVFIPHWPVSIRLKGQFNQTCKPSCYLTSLLMAIQLRLSSRVQQQLSTDERIKIPDVFWMQCFTLTATHCRNINTCGRHEHHLVVLTRDQTSITKGAGNDCYCKSLFTKCCLRHM